VFAFCCVMPMEFSGVHGRSLEVPVNFLAGLSPPVNMAWLPIRAFERSDDFNLTGPRVVYPPFWILGLVAWGLLSVGLSQACVGRFRELANRSDKPGPESLRFADPPPPPPKPAG
jgi:hypothetical protein